MVVVVAVVVLVVVGVLVVVVVWLCDCGCVMDVVISLFATKNKINYKNQRQK